MPQLLHGLTVPGCSYRRQSLRKAHWVAGLLIASLCLTLAGLLNTDLPVSVTEVPSYELNTMGTDVDPS
ncbi:hypothetical protein L9F63_012226, partial [Diploptera punctata]